MATSINAIFGNLIAGFAGTTAAAAAGCAVTEADAAGSGRVGAGTGAIGLAGTDRAGVAVVVAGGIIPVVESTAGNVVVVVVALGVIVVAGVTELSVGTDVVVFKSVDDESSVELVGSSRLLPSGSNRPPDGTPKESRFCAIKSTISGSFINPLFA